jgi:hypothetical protein
MANHNDTVGERFFSHDRVAQELTAILTVPRSVWMAAGGQRGRMTSAGRPGPA